LVTIFTETKIPVIIILYSFFLSAVSVCRHARARTYAHAPIYPSFTGCLILLNRFSDASKRVKPSRKVLYHFAIFAAVNELLITIYCWINMHSQLAAKRKRATKYNHPVIIVARHVENCLLQAAMTTQPLIINNVNCCKNCEMLQDYFSTQFSPLYLQRALC